jgi:anti-sigma B factor antagonist
MSLEITITQKDGIAVMRFDGRLTLGEGTSRLRQEIEALETKGGKLVLDFTEVTYIDSAGLGEMVRLKGKCDEAGIEVRLAGANVRTVALLQLTKLATLFPLDEDVAAAARAL